MDIRDDGSFAMDMSYFAYHHKDQMPSKKLCALLGGPVRTPESKVSRRHKDIAAALQMITEDVLTKILHHVHKETKQENIVIAGGVGLNSVFNGKILGSTPFKRVWIQPAAGDDGTSLGAAFFVYNTILRNKRSYQMKHAYLGPEYSKTHIRRFLDGNSINYSEFKDEKVLSNKAVELILKNQVIGWFQGRMEWGPRALGARSILANPLNPKMRDVLNLKVKHRESFRPFAPVVCLEDALTYFDCDDPVPQPADFMLMVYPVRKQWRKKLSSVTHVDGSGRLQTVRRFQNPLYYNLIREFGRRTGFPILINTSFNIRGEPIVCTPYDAYRCMMGTGIDCLFMDRFLIRRKDNQRDNWDSEKLASD
jgi:carbamoyltransferase